MNGFRSRTIARVRERSPLVLEPLESRLLLSADNPFAAPVFTALPQPPQIVSGLGSWQQPIDADNNGFGDIVLSYGDGASPSASSNVSVMLGQADGHFTQQAVVVLSGDVKLVDVVDLNNDNKPDIVVHWERQSPTPQGFIDVYKNNGNGTFTHQGSPIPVAPDWSLDIVDMNGDGKQDLFVTNPGDDTVDVYLGNGNCTFQAAAETNFGAGKTITYHTQDVNNDHILDAVLEYSVSSPTPGSNIEVHLGQSNGLYNPTASWQDTGSFSHVDSLEDLTGDNLPDLLIYRRSSFLPTDAATVLAFRNIGGGDFTQAWSKDFANGFSGGSEAVDLDGNGTKDLVLTDGFFGSGTERTVYVEHNPGNAAFTDAQNFGVADLLLAFTTPGTDVDHDGRPDLVADLYATSGGVTTDWGVKIFFNDGAGTFLTASPVLVQPTTAPSLLVGQVLDLNSDHRLDVVFLNRTTDENHAITADQIETVMNTGGRTFGAEQVTDFGPNTMADVVVMDFNGDGNADAVPAFNVIYDQASGDYTAGGFTFWRGTGTGTFIAAASPNTTSGRIETTITDAGPFEVPSDSNLDLLLSGATPTTGLYVALNTTTGGGSGDQTPPTADLADPTNGGSISLTTLNGRHTFDVTFSDAGGSGVKASTITDAGQEFTLSGAGAAGVTIGGAPTLVSGTTYRYSFTGSFSAGPVNVNFTAGSFTDIAGNPNAAATEAFTVTGAVDATPPTADLSDPANGGAIVAADLNARGTMDVTFADAGGSGLNAATVTDSGAEFTLSGAAAAGVTVNGAPTLVSGTTYRYSFTGAFSTGHVGLNFTAGAWADGIGNLNAAASEGFDVVASAEQVPIARQTSADGLVHVSIYDVVGPVDVDPANVKVVFGKNDTVASITLSGAQPMEGLGIVISGAASVGAIKDARTTPGTVAFIASNSAIASLTLKSGTSGYNLDGLSLGGLTFPADIDAESATHATALYCTGFVPSVALGGTASGDFWIGGADPKTLLSNKSFTVKNGGLEGDLVTGGAEGAVALAGDFDSHLNIGGALTSLTIKGGNFCGTLDAAGLVSAISISSQKVAGVTVGGGVTTGAAVHVTGIDLKTSVSLKSFAATGAISGLDMMLSGGLGTLKGAGWSGGSLQAASSGAITLTGDFDSRINIAGPLASLTIKGGDFSGSLGDLGNQGPVGAISISSQKVAGVTVGGNITAGAEFNFNGVDSKTNLALKSLSATGTVTSLNLASLSGLGSITTGSWTGGGVAAPFFNSLTVKGDMTSAAIHLDGQDPKGNSLGSLSVTGWFQGSEVRTDANMASVTVGGIRNSNVFAGIAPGVTGLPTVAGNFVASAKISSFSVKGTVKQDGEFSMIGSNIAAHDFGTIGLAGINLDNGGVPFGVSSFHIASITVKDISGTRHFSNLDLPSDSVSQQDVNVLIL